MLMSYVVDGFADVGTMLGAKLLGAGEFSAMRALVRRLDVLGVASGAAAAARAALALLLALILQAHRPNRVRAEAALLFAARSAAAAQRQWAAKSSQVYSIR